MNVLRALLLSLHLKAWRWLHPSRSRLPLDLWWRLAPEIPVVAMNAASLDQSGFQFYNDDGDEANSTSVAAEDTNATLDVDTVYHLRIQVEDTATGGENNVQLQLQYNLNAAGWNNVNASSSVVQSSASLLTDMADTTARLTAPTGGTFITPNGGQDELDGTIGDSNEIDFIDGTHDYVEGVYAFQILSGDVADADTIQFRVIRSAGGTVLESYSVTPQATVNEAAAGTLDQANFRIRSGDTDTLNGTTDWAAALNTGATIDLETRFRIRFEVEASGGSVTDGYKIEYNLNAGGWNPVPTTPLDWGARESVARIEAVDSKQYADADPTTDILSGSAGAFIAGEGVEEDNLTGSIALADTEHTEVEFCVLLHRYGDGPLELTDGDTIDFRVVRDDGTALATYTNTPTVTVNDPLGLVGGTYAENPGQIGPFEDSNGNKYVLIEPTETDPEIMMVKSTDGGDTWVEVDAINAPTIGDVEGLEIVEGTDQLLVFHQPGDVPRLHIFNMSSHGTPDLWASTDQAIDSAILDSFDQQITGTLRSDGTMVAVYTGDTNDPAANGDVWANIRSSGGAWGTPFLVFDLANNDNWGVVGVLGDSDNFYVFSIDLTAGTLYGKRISSTDVLEDLFGTSIAATDTGTTVDTNVGTDNGDRQNHTVPVYWNDGSPKIWIGWVDATSKDLEGVVITVGSGGSVGTVSESINDADNVAQDSSSRQPMAHFVRDGSGDLHAFFATESVGGGLSELSHDVSSDDGATWGTDETVTLRSPKSRINWIRAAIDPAGSAVQLFYDDASGVEQNNDATGGDNTSGVAGLATGFIWYDEYSLSTGVSQQVGQAVETDTAQPVGSAKTTTIGQAAETDTAQAVGSAKAFAVGQAAETDTAQSVGSAKATVIGQAVEMDTAQPVTAQGALVVAIGQAAEADTAQPVGSAKTAAIGQAAEVDTAQALESEKTQVVGQAVEADTAQSVASAKTLAVGQAAETDTAQAVSSGSEQVVAIGQAAETDTAQALGAEKTAGVGQAAETDTAHGVTTSKAFAIGQAVETDTAQALESSKTFAVSQAVETDTAGSVTAEHSVTVGQAATTSSAFGLTWAKAVAVGQAVETDTALTVTASGGAPVLLEVGSLAYYQFHRISGNLVLAPVGRSARRGYRTSEGFERVSDVIRVDQDGSSAAHKSQAMEAVAGAWSTHSGSDAATLKTAIHEALQNAGFRGQGGVDLA